MKLRRVTAGWALLGVFAGLLSGVLGDVPARAATTLAPGFHDELVANVHQPTAMDFTPDGRLLIGALAGTLHVYQGGVLLPVPALTLGPRVCVTGERGLLGITPDPAFSSNHYIYIYYTFNKTDLCDTRDGPVNRVSRFTLPDSNVIDPASEVVLVDNIVSIGHHNAGDLHFGADNLLYVSVGDAGCQVSNHGACHNLNDNAHKLTHLLGKILRIRTDGTFPADNPYATQPGVRRCGDPAGVPAGEGVCGEIFATGLRNPFRFAFKPGTNTFYINDVGTDVWEEINLGAKGADYGFNLREGHCAANSRTDCGDPGLDLTNPIYDYDHQTGCSAVTGATFVPTGAWPAPWSGSYLYSDYTCGKIFRLAPKSEGGFTSEVLAQGLGIGSAVTMTFGPAGYRSLYYATYLNDGEIRRIARGNPPTASFTASPTSGPRPLTVNFDASASTDPEGDPLIYRWDLGDGTPRVDTAVPTISHRFPSDGPFTVTLRVGDGSRDSGPAQRLIEVGRPPSAKIQSPSPTALFSVGQRVTVTGQGTDPDDGALPGSALSWEVVRYHDTHTHPFLGPVTGSSITFEYPSPEDLRAATNSFLEVRLTARDASGLQRTTTQKLMPKKVNLTFQTNRSTPRLKVEDETFSGPKTYVSWPGALLRVNAPSPQVVSNRTYVFQDWSDGKPANHAIVVPASDRTYTAGYARSSGGEPPPPGPAVHAIIRTPTGGGHWMPASTGKVYTAGDAAFLGDASSLAPASPVAGMAATPDGRGYWLATAKGKVYSFGTARFLGDASGTPLNRPIVTMAATPSGNGYWLVASDGGVFSFGDAPFRGSTGGIRLNKPIVGMATTPTGDGYWLVASDGGVFTFGDAPFRGSTGGIRLNKPVVGMAASVMGNGYWLVASDGGIFAFNAPFVGSAGGSKLSTPVVGMAATPSGTGYWISATDGLVLNYGDARFYP